MRTLTVAVDVAAEQTDAVVLAAVAGKRIEVLGGILQPGGTDTDITFNSKPADGAGVAISPLFANAANAFNPLPISQEAWFSTSLGEALTCTTGTGASTGILLKVRIV